MSIKVGINGFGRIGRMVMRCCMDHPNIEIVGVNDLCPADYLAYMLKFDTMHGKFKGEVSSEGNNIVVNGKAIPKERAEALEIRNRMKDMTVVVTAKGGGAGRLFGSVTNTEVADALAKQADIKLDKRKIVLDEPIKAIGVYTVKCKLGYEINADLKVEVKEG